MSTAAVRVYAVDVPTFKALVEGEITIHDISLSYSNGALCKFYPTGRTYSIPDFGGYTFFECSEGQ